MRHPLVLTLLAIALSIPPAAGTAQQVMLRRDRLTRLATDSAIRSPVAVLGREGTDTVRVSAEGLQLERGQFAILGAAEGVREVAGPPVVPEATRDDSMVIDAAERFRTLPFVLITPDATLSGEWVLRPIYKVVEPMRWRPDQNGFLGSFFFALQDTVRPGESRPVDPAIPFELVGDADVAPAQVRIAHTNLPLQRVDVLALDAVDSVRVHVVPGSELGGHDLWIPVQPSLTVSIEPRRIQGWGIQTGKVVARVVGTSRVEPIVASATAARSTLDSTRFRIDESGAGEIRFRTSGVGRDTIDVFVAGIGRVTTTVEVVLPWVFLLAAVLGGVFGGVGAAAQTRKGRRKVRWLEHALKGAFAGVLAAVAWYALGISLLRVEVGVDRFNELAVFGFAALAAYFGIPKPKPDPEPAS
jgi:hypothetical protein